MPIHEFHDRESGFNYYCYGNCRHHRYYFNPYSASSKASAYNKALKQAKAIHASQARQAARQRR